MKNNDDKIKEIEKKKLNKEPETVYKITD